MSKRAHQFSFFPPEKKFFGGELLNKRRKSQRPLAFKKTVHLVLRSTKARGPWGFLAGRNKQKIETWLQKFARHNGIRLYQRAIAWNHLHLAVLLPNRAAYNKFIRSLSGTLPKVVFGFRHPTETFWDFRPFSRIVEWGKDFRSTCRYILRNTLEAEGLLPYSRGADPYARWLRDFY